MPELEDIFKQSNPNAGPALYEGEFASTPDTVDEPALVLISSIDPAHTYGPCPWAPRVTEDGHAQMPAEGDSCLVAMGSAGEDGNINPWVVMWWPYS